MNDAPLVSVCIPVYNAEKYLSDSIESVIKQSYRNLEVVVVNDGSTDGTSKLLERYKSKGVKIIEQDNKGQCNAANRAYKASSGEYIKFFDADDILSEDFIKNQVTTLRGTKNVIASASWGRFYKNDLNTFNLVNEPVYKNLEPIEWLVEAMWKRQAMMQCALWLIPRDIIDKAGLWDESLSLINDFEYFIRIILNSEEVRHSKDAILYYRSGSNSSLSALNNRKGAESAFKSIMMGITYMLDFENTDRVKTIAANCLQTFVYDFYPRHRDLLLLAEKKIEELGVRTEAYYSSGYTKTLVNIIGWKSTKKLKQFFK